MRKFIDKLLLMTVPGLGLAVLFLVGWYTRLRVREGHTAPPGRKREGIIYAFWHEQLLMHAYYYRGMGINGLISASKDGEYATRGLEKIGYKCIRGSSSRGGGDALRKMVRVLRHGESLALAPDGPRGPGRKAQIGALALAGLSGAPIVPIALVARRCKRLKSWDRQVIPLPGSIIVSASGKMIRVGRDAGEAELEKRRKELENELMRILETAERSSE